MQVKVHGFDENGKAIVTRKTTPILITELIDKFPKMCDAEISHALEDIRKSSEQDNRIRKMYASILHDKNKSEKNDDTYIKHEKEIIKDGMDAIRKCIDVHHDITTALTIIRLCKEIAGEKFETKIVLDGKDGHIDLERKEEH